MENNLGKDILSIMIEYVASCQVRCGSKTKTTPYFR